MYMVMKVEREELDQGYMDVVVRYGKPTPDVDTAIRKLDKCPHGGWVQHYPSMRVVHHTIRVGE